MIVAGDLSGIQSYLFDVADEGGGQAQRLRARSFVLQIIPEVAALRTVETLGWPLSSIRMSGAGKFLIRGKPPEDVDQRLASVEKAVNEWLLSHMHGELRFALCWSGDEGTETDQYREVMRRLQAAKATSWKSVGVDQSRWQPSQLVLSPLDTPCVLCRHERGEVDEVDEETGESRLICRRCADDRKLGRQLPRATTLIIHTKTTAKAFDVLGLGVEITDGEPTNLKGSTVAVANLRAPETCPAGCPPDRFLRRRLMCHVPADESGQPLWFEHLAKKSRGDHLLGVLKADADSLGASLEELVGGSSLQPLETFSRLLDEFFSGRLKDELESGSNSAWQDIYTVFGGGDDLLMVGPWNVMFDFADRLHELFLKGFGAYRLTISAGIALTKWKRPIKLAVSRAEETLELAKTHAAPGASNPKDQCCAFGQIWKWKDHSTIISAGKQLADWVDSNIAERGWLHILLRLAEARFGDAEQGREPDPLATARLSYQVVRNYRPGSPVRRWAEDLVADFDRGSNATTRYLPTIVRYALTATRKPQED